MRVTDAGRARNTNDLPQISAGQKITVVACLIAAFYLGRLIPTFSQTVFNQQFSQVSLSPLMDYGWEAIILKKDCDRIVSGFDIAQVRQALDGMKKSKNPASLEHWFKPGEPSLPHHRKLKLLERCSNRLFPIEQLLQQGVDINEIDPYKFTLLMKAVMWKDPGLASFLIRNGADLEVTNERGETALHIAAQENAPEIAAALLDAGANIEAVDMTHSTPLKWSIAMNNLESTRMLVERGADIFGKKEHGGSSLIFSITYALRGDLSSLRILTKTKGISAFDACESLDEFSQLLGISFPPSKDAALEELEEWVCEAQKNWPSIQAKISQTRQEQATA